MICSCRDSGVSVNQEKIHEAIFYSPETYNKLVLATSMDSDKKDLFIVLQHFSGIGEDNISLMSCFENKEIRSYHLEINYLIKMLGLFSALCKGRNFVCKSSVNN